MRSRKRTCIFVINVKPNAVLKLLKQHGTQTLVPPKMIFLYLDLA